MLNRFAVRSFIVLLGYAARARSAQFEGPVTLIDGGEQVVLDNGLLKVAFDKSKASILSMRYRGLEMLNSGYYSMDGGASFRTPAHCKYAVKTQSPDMVDIEMTRVWKDEPQAFDIDVHYRAAAWGQRDLLLCDAEPSRFLSGNGRRRMADGLETLQ